MITPSNTECLTLFDYGAADYQLTRSTMFVTDKRVAVLDGE
jgi:hypothetical protein